jgi:ABC-2 type transport system ATP-binding protein
MIVAQLLTRRFGAQTAVSGASFEARPGEILGVLGPNGAGKTTTLRMLCGYLAPTSGTASVFGRDIVRDSLEVRRQIGYLPENNPLYPEMRVHEYLRFRAGLKGVARARRTARVAEVVAQCGLPEVAGQTIGTLSKGYRQRVGLADALVANPPVLVLDEPTSGLDPNQVQDLRALVRSLAGEHTVLFSSHQLHEVEQVSDRVVIFRQGRVIAEDRVEQLRVAAHRGATCTVEIRDADRAHLPELTDGLARVVQVEDLEDGWSRAVLDARADPREALFVRAAAAGIVLRELTRRQLSLEEVFRELTRGEDPAAPDRDHAAGEEPS